MPDRALKQENKTLSPPDLNPLLPDAVSVTATLVEATKSNEPTGPKKSYRYTSGTLNAAVSNAASFQMLNYKPDYWIVVCFGSGALTNIVVSEEGTPPYYATCINNVVKLVIPANSRTVNISKTGNDVNYIIAGASGYECSLDALVSSS